LLGILLYFGDLLDGTFCQNTSISKAKIFKNLAFAGWKIIENLLGTLMHFSHKNPLYESHWIFIFLVT
jgi:hypothetical protein